MAFQNIKAFWRSYCAECLSRLVSRDWILGVIGENAGKEWSGVEALHLSKCIGNLVP